MQRSLKRERESPQRRWQGQLEESHTPGHKTGHRETYFHGAQIGEPFPQDSPPKPRQRVSPTRQRLVLVLFLGKDGAGGCVLGNKLPDF